MHKRGFIIFLIVVGTIFFGALFLYNQIKSSGESIISTFGFFGLIFVVMILDIVVQPIPPDIIVFGAGLSGESVFYPALLTGVGSLLGATVAFFLGKKFGPDEFIKWFGERKFQQGEKLIKKWGGWAVAVGALTPVPYSAICWVSGILQMNYKKFIVISAFTRIPRFLVVGYIGYLL